MQLVTLLIQSAALTLSRKYEKSGDQISEEKWFAQVKNPNTGESFQLEDLRAVGAVPADFRKDEKPKKYPVEKDR